jgi:hypothetical protein
MILAVERFRVVNGMEDAAEAVVTVAYGTCRDRRGPAVVS